MPRQRTESTANSRRSMEREIRNGLGDRHQPRDGLAPVRDCVRLAGRDGLQHSAAVVAELSVADSWLHPHIVAPVARHDFSSSPLSCRALTPPASFIPNGHSPTNRLNLSALPVDAGPRRRFSSGAAQRCPWCARPQRRIDRDGYLSAESAKACSRKRSATGLRILRRTPASSGTRSHSPMASW